MRGEKWVGHSAINFLKWHCTAQSTAGSTSTWIMGSSQQETALLWSDITEKLPTWQSTFFKCQHCTINSWSHLICFAATCAANIVNHSNCPWKHIWGHGVATNNNWCLTCWILKFITYLLEKFPKKVPGFTKSKGCHPFWENFILVKKFLIDQKEVIRAMPERIFLYWGLRRLP